MFAHITPWLILFLGVRTLCKPWARQGLSLQISSSESYFGNLSALSFGIDSVRRGPLSSRQAVYETAVNQVRKCLEKGELLLAVKQFCKTQRTGADSVDKCKMSLRRDSLEGSGLGEDKGRKGPGVVILLQCYGLIVPQDSIPPFFRLGLSRWLHEIF